MVYVSYTLNDVNGMLKIWFEMKNITLIPQGINLSLPYTAIDSLNNSNSSDIDMMTCAQSSQSWYRNCMVILLLTSKTYTPLATIHCSGNTALSFK